MDFSLLTQAVIRKSLLVATSLFKLPTIALCTGNLKKSLKPINKPIATSCIDLVGLGCKRCLHRLTARIERVAQRCVPQPVRGQHDVGLLLALLLDLPHGLPAIMTALAFGENALRARHDFVKSAHLGGNNLITS